MPVLRPIKLLSIVASRFPGRARWRSRSAPAPTIVSRMSIAIIQIPPSSVAAPQQVAYASDESMLYTYNRSLSRRLKLVEVAYHSPRYALPVIISPSICRTRGVVPSWYRPQLRVISTSLTNDFYVVTNSNPVNGCHRSPLVNNSRSALAEFHHAPHLPDPVAPAWLPSCSQLHDGTLAQRDQHQQTLCTEFNMPDGHF